jgi:hypothetical protein
VISTRSARASPPGRAPASGHGPRIPLRGRRRGIRREHLAGVDHQVADYGQNACPGSRARLWRALPRARYAFSQTALCDSLDELRASRGSAIRSRVGRAAFVENQLSHPGVDRTVARGGPGVRCGAAIASAALGSGIRRTGQTAALPPELLQLAVWRRWTAHVEVLDSSGPWSPKPARIYANPRVERWRCDPRHPHCHAVSGASSRLFTGAFPTGYDLIRQFDRRSSASEPARPAHAGVGPRGRPASERDLRGVRAHQAPARASPALAPERMWEIYQGIDRRRSRPVEGLR